MKRIILLIAISLLLFSACGIVKGYETSDNKVQGVSTSSFSIVGLWYAYDSVEGDEGFYYDFRDDGKWYIADSHGDIITEYLYTINNGCIETYNEEGQLIQYSITFDGEKMILSDTTDPYIRFTFVNVDGMSH